MLWNYRSMKFHLCSWVIAIEFAKKLFKEIEIYTDKEWKKIFDKLWYESNTELESLDLNLWFRAWWKLLTYSLQNKPFVHIDSDCFLWKALPDEIMTSWLFAQNEESDDWFKSAYQWQIDYMLQKWFYLPDNIKNINVKKASCLWIVWWNDYKFISDYSKQALDIINKNKKNWLWMQDVWLYNVIFEQWMFDVLAAQNNKKIQYLTYPGIDKEKLTDMWYQHLWWAKKDKKTEQMVIEFCKMEYPNLFNIITTLC